MYYFRGGAVTLRQAAVIVTIKEQMWFTCRDDEEHFFRWLYDLPAYENVRGTSAGLEISFRDPIDEDSMFRLIGLLKRYSLNLKPLNVLCHPGIEAWLKDDAKYWHAEMFGNDTADK